MYLKRRHCDLLKMYIPRNTTGKKRKETHGRYEIDREIQNTDKKIPTDLK